MTSARKLALSAALLSAIPLTMPAIAQTYQMQPPPKGPTALEQDKERRARLEAKRRRIQTQEESRVPSVRYTEQFETLDLDRYNGLPQADLGKRSTPLRKSSPRSPLVPQQ